MVYLVLYLLVAMHYGISRLAFVLAMHYGISRLAFVLVAMHYGISRLIFVSSNALWYILSCICSSFMICY